ncbi:MAG: Integral membrane sensor hybrid histidine kinase [Candidatus Daviesbacteria bacterium GW2011_GWA2_38_24]|uniref:histidine kinase n=1 Tax=Candidatus Daviesbacteria bacterium GW2011_GWA2_38_24 TaxID=1618422 RepID=A0A0G0JJG0_9BACT|nr:MAG: Integral membrane sensor hybrid histidine kinase [Candidatus Daviesbacteria bacterium GW2011_GWA2_38_24]KKQ80742.1 MAG: Integral membrane sensor hybrid histidine kinase [Candidatus Daviesbacteria bacterium GW2011_GWA1_38_7]
MGRKVALNYANKNVYFTILAFIVLFILLFAAKVYSYLLFHTSAELFSVVIAVCVFVFAWNTRKIGNNSYFSFIGISFLFVGIIDLVHTLAYKGMFIFPSFDANTPTQLWIAGRYLLAIPFLIAPIFIARKFNEKLMLLLYFLVTLLILLSVFYWKSFPVSYIEGVGLTPFKKVSEYIISLIFLTSIIILKFFKDKFDKTVYLLLTLSLAINIISELLFTLYIGVYDVSNMLGHYGKILSYYLAYKAIIEVGLTKPFNLMFLELKQNEQRKDDFLRIVSHELKTPITTIKGYSQFLASQLKKSKNSKHSYYVSQITAQADKMNSLIDDFLNTTKIESGQMTFKTREFDLHELTSEVVDEIQRLQKNQRIKLKSKANIKVFGDRQRIGQVLSNLIYNAIKYSPEDKKIKIQVMPNTRNVIVSVEDSGIGIPKNKQQNIFSKYYRTEKGQQKADGLGLGLYISKEIIKHHKGKIWVESEEGKGSKFSFTLPLR